MAALSHCSDTSCYRGVRCRVSDDDISLEQINSIVNQLTDNIAQAPSMSEFGSAVRHDREPVFRVFSGGDRKQFHRFRQIRCAQRACLL